MSPLTILLVAIYIAIFLWMRVATRDRYRDVMINTSLIFAVGFVFWCFVFMPFFGLTFYRIGLTATP